LNAETKRPSSKPRIIWMFSRLGKDKESDECLKEIGNSLQG
jgi:hypothetical protein